jgi:cation diffusion facilitator family transporter
VQDHSRLTHSHVFDAGNRAGERGTRAVMLITAAMMVVEIVTGWWFNSMALLADGWHMSSHAVAIGLSAFAYGAARRYARDERFAFGAWKIEVLAGFASAVFLLCVAAVMAFASVERLFVPQPIEFSQALVIATLGLAVNIVCAFVLQQSDDRAHGHDHGHAAHGGHAAHDLNLRSAYVHVLADAATSVLAIAALAGGMLYGWNWLDPVMGLVGSVLVARWAYGLIRDTSRVLLDREMDHPVVAEIREAIAGHAAPAAIVDLHVWRVGREKFAVIVSLATQDSRVTPQAIRELLRQHEELAHISVEVLRI